MAIPMLTLQVIACSTRPGRAGFPIAKWFVEQAQKHGTLAVELVDLKEVNLPVFDEPKHPRLQQYEHAHTKAWSAIVSRADAFVFVTPEYNYGMPPSLLNALTFLSKEWARKPAGIVSYGGVSAGTRSAQMAKQTLTSLSIMPLPQAVSIPFFMKLITADVFNPGDTQDAGVKAMLDELALWAGALKTIRG
jgi:NAD(P)H-dependent FMN reductase